MRRVIKYDVIEKNIRGPKMTAKQTVSKKAVERQWEKFNAPSSATYDLKQHEIGNEAPKFTFARDKRERTPSPDFMREINPNIDAVRKVAPAVSIKPEHEVTLNEIMREYENAKTGGPAMYTPGFKLVEKRLDVGAVKIQPKHHDKEEEEDTRPAIDPEPIKSNKLVFKYHEPTDQLPQHAPTSVLYPGRWVFYDVDLDAVRE